MRKYVIVVITHFKQFFMEFWRIILIDSRCVKYCTCREFDREVWNILNGLNVVKREIRLNTSNYDFMIDIKNRLTKQGSQLANRTELRRPTNGFSVILLPLLYYEVCRYTAIANLPAMRGKPKHEKRRENWEAMMLRYACLQFSRSQE